MNTMHTMTLPKYWQTAPPSYSIHALVLLLIAILSSLLIIWAIVLQREVSLHDQGFDPVADSHYVAATGNGMDASA